MWIENFAIALTNVSYLTPISNQYTRRAEIQCESYQVHDNISSVTGKATMSRAHRGSFVIWETCVCRSFDHRGQLRGPESIISGTLA